MASNKALCFICNKEKIVFKCQGCSKDFCRTHVNEHHQALSQELDELENERNQFQQTIAEQEKNIENHSLMKKINQWEQNSIEKIKQTAQQCRESLNQRLNRSISQIQEKFLQFTEQFKIIRRDDEFNETDINHLKHQLTQIQKELSQPSTISIREDSLSSFINKISIDSSPVSEQMKWGQYATTVAGGNGHGNQLDQLYHPFGISINRDQTIYIADFSNHRIIQWKSGENVGQIIAGRNGEGNRTDQLNFPTDICIDQINNSLIIADRNNSRVIRCSLQNPRDQQILFSDIDCWGVTMDKHGSIYVSDWKQNEVRRWKKGETQGTIVAGGHGLGNQLNQCNYPTYVFVDEDDSIYISDSGNHRVMKWFKDAREGIVVAGGNGQGNSLNQLSHPHGVIIHHLGQIYVADCNNHRVMRWYEGREEGEIVVGGNGKADKSNQLNRPIGLSFDIEGNLYVSDLGNHRIQKFEIDLQNKIKMFLI